MHIKFPVHAPASANTLDARASLLTADDLIGQTSRSSGQHAATGTLVSIRGIIRVAIELIISFVSPLGRNGRTSFARTSRYGLVADLARLSLYDHTALAQQ
jgi:hypothetical protein